MSKDDIKNVLQELRKVKYIPFTRLENMEFFKNYNITSVKRMDTKYGEKTIFELDEVIQISLPSYYNNISMKTLEKINAGGYFMRNSGKISEYGWNLEFFHKTNYAFALPTIEEFYE